MVVYRIAYEGFTQDGCNGREWYDGMEDAVYSSREQAEKELPEDYYYGYSGCKYRVVEQEVK